MQHHASTTPRPRAMPASLALADITSPYDAFRPPKRVRVSEGAAQALYIRQPGGYTGPWSADEAPYMVEPMDMLASRRHEAVVFVGPSRTGKTMGLLDGWVSYAVTCDPGDMLIVQMTQEKARDYSKTRIDRAIRYSPRLKEMMTSRGQDDNTFDKMFRHGMWLKIGWPSATQLSGSDYRYVGFTDYDRMPDDIDGEGSGFGMGLKRTQTFLSRGMCMVESSPGRPLTDPSWKPATPHEAPPCGGIMGIYNRGNRKRLYWQCPHCGEWFEAAPGLGLFRLPDEVALLEAVRIADLEEIAQAHNRVICPHCVAPIDKRHKQLMNRRGVWLADGEFILPNGKREGDPMQSTIASYWLGGVAAAYQPWHSLVLRYLQGLREYALTGVELGLQTTVNTDQGMPYMSRILALAAATRAKPEDRKERNLERFIVPERARFLAAAVDVQGGQNARFVVQVHAVGEHLEQWPIDRYSITTSRRPGIGEEFAPLDPAAYPEDWDMLTELVLKATYRLQEDGKELRVRMVGVDTGGEDGVTAQSYEWFRRMRAEGYHGRIMLVKGASTKTAPLIRESFVGAKKKGEKGDIPLYMLNPNLLKDAVKGSLKREDEGPSFFHVPAWLPQSFWDEMDAEVRRPDGVWEQVRKRNEALDCSCYIRAVCMRLGADKPSFWAAPPRWALPLDENSDVITRDERRQMQAAAPVAEIRRRVVRSAYLK